MYMFVYVTNHGKTTLWKSSKILHSVLYKFRFWKELIDLDGLVKVSYHIVYLRHMF